MRRDSVCGSEKLTRSFTTLQDKFRTRVAANHLGVVQSLIQANPREKMKLRRMKRSTATANQANP